MATRIWRGDAAAVAQVVTITPGDLVVGRTYALQINGKDVSVVAQTTSAADLCVLFVRALQATIIPEFREVVPTTASGVLTLTSRASGIPFVVTGLVGGFRQTAAITVQIKHSPSGGSWSWIDADEGTASIAYDDTAAEAQTSLESLYGAGNLAVSLEDSTYIVRFIGTRAADPVPAVTVDGSGLTGGDAAPVITTIQTAAVGTDAVQTITLHGASSGTWRAGFRGVFTAAVAYNVSAADLQAALRAISSINGANVNVSGSNGGPYTITFVGTLGHRVVESLEVDTSMLVGSIYAEITTTTNGVAGQNCKQYLTQVSGLDEIFTLKRSGTVTGGTFTWKYDSNANEISSAAIAWDARLCDIVATLEALVKTKMQGTYEGPYFAPAYAWQANQTMAEASGAFYIACIGEAGARNIVLGNGTPLRAVAVASSLTGGGTYTAPGTDGTDGMAWSQPLAAESKFKLRVGFTGYMTPELTLSVGPLGEILSPTAAQVQTAVENLANVGAGNVIVRSLRRADGYFSNFHSRALFEFEFTGALAGATVALIDCVVTAGGVWSGAVYMKQNGIAGTTEVQTLTVYGTPSTGSFRLGYAGEFSQPIAYDATASTVSARLDAVGTIPTGAIVASGGALPGTAITLTCAGAFTYLDIAPLTVDDTALKSTVAQTTAGVNGRNEKVSLSLTGQDVWAGTVTFTVASTALSAVNWNTTYTALQAALDAGLGSNKATASGGPWPNTDLVIEYVGSNAETNMADITATDTLKNGLAIMTLYDPFSVVTTVRPTGPNYWSEPVNWSNPADPADRTVPGPGDSVYLADGRVDVLYGTVQRFRFTVDTARDYLVPATPHDLRPNQRIQVWTTDNDLPAGLAAATNYYVRDLNHDTGVFRLATTIGGPAVNITDAGTGTHTAGVRLDRLVSLATYTGSIGLPWLSTAGYKEYRPLYLCVGLEPSGAKLVTIGQGVGNGSSRFHLDTGTDQAIVEVLGSAGSGDGTPSVWWVGAHASTIVKLFGGELGIAPRVGESASFASLEQRAGQISMGVVSFVSWDKTGGEIGLVSQASISGVTMIRG